MVFKAHQLIALALMIFSFYMSAMVSRVVFERLPHLEDELAYLYQARIFANGDVVVDIPELRRAFWQPFVIDYRETGNRFGKYAPGWPLWLSVGVQLGQLWVMNAFFAMLTVGLVYRLGLEIFNPDVGVIAASLTAFSPMMLLLNATLMSHTSALFTLTLFMYAYWRIEKGKHATLWGVVAGIALGLTAINRPLTAMAAVLPFVIWSGLRVIRAAYYQFMASGQEDETAVDLALVETPPRYERLIPTLRPQIILAIFTLIISMAVPLFNLATVEDASTNLYTLVWEYDQVGFGTCCGRSSQDGGEGHTIVKGIRHSRFDLSLMAADLFGWQIGEMTENGELRPEIEDHLLRQADYWETFGLSFFLLPLGLLVGLRPHWLKAWALIGVGWIVTPFINDMDFLLDNSEAIWLWLTTFFLWMLIPPVYAAFNSRERETKTVYTWLFLGVVVGIISLQLAYWIGSQRYSTRYYSETITAFALLTALPIAFFARRISRSLIYTIFGFVIVFSYLTYSVPRIDVLHQFNRVSTAWIDEVENRRTSDDPVLVLVAADPGNISWRAYGTFMALTDPYFESDIIGAWDYTNGGEAQQEIIAAFPERQVIHMTAEGEISQFVDTPPTKPIITEEGDPQDNSPAALPLPPLFNSDENTPPIGEAETSASPNIGVTSLPPNAPPFVTGLPADLPPPFLPTPTPEG